MWFGVLGTLEARHGSGEPVRVQGPARRQLLAALLCRAGVTVPVSDLIDDLWGAAPPRKAAKTLQSHVARLRDDLGAGAASVLVTEPGGYRLDLDRADIDALTFEELVNAGEGDPEAKLARLDKALALWRGAAYADLGDAAFAVVERVRLSELRSAARERRVDLALMLGASRSLVAELEQHVSAEPFRERGWEQLALALYRSGRQADALATIGRARDVLAAELGVDPGPGLRELERRILVHDEDLLVPEQRTRVALSNAPAEPAACPYRGLDGYTEHDSAVFFGRERLTAEVVSLLNDHGVVVIAGASGSGKSSLVRAGVVPALRRGALPGSASWRSVISRPTAIDPAVIDGDLIVLDQAEELFTLCDDATRVRAVEALLDRVEAGQHLVVVIRGDHYGRLAELSFGPYAERATVLVGPMRDDELARAVQEPASVAGVTVEPALLDEVLDEAHGRAGALPMLSAALVAAWGERDEPRLLTLAGYRRGGGVARAIGAAADRCYDRLGSDERVQARNLLVRLATRDPAGGWIRRPLSRQDAGEHADHAVVEALLAARLISVAGDRVEVSHEALLTEWPRLRSWLEERASAAELLEHVRNAERSWRAAGCVETDLYRGARLQDALDRRVEHPADFSRSENEFLDASQAVATNELTLARERAAREAAGRRRLRWIAVALAAMIVVALITAGVAISERGTARNEAARARSAALAADARKLAAEALTAPDLRTSLLLAAAAYRMQDSTDTRSGLLAAIERSGVPQYRISTQNRVQWVGVDRAAATLWEEDNQTQVTRFDAKTGRVLGTFPLQASHVVAMSPDAREILAVGAATPTDTAGATRAIVLDADTGAVLRILPVSTVQSGTAYRTAAFTGDGHWLAVMEADPSDPSTPLPTMAVFDARHLDRAPRVLRLDTNITAVAAGTQRLAVQTAGGDLAVIDPASLRVVAKGYRPELALPPDQREGAEGILTMSPDDHWIAVSGDQVEVFAPNGLRRTPAAILNPVNDVNSMAISPASDLLAVGQGNGEVDLLRLDSGTLGARESGNNGQVMSVVWSGRTARDEQLFAGGLDSQIVAYDVRQLARQITFGPIQTAANDFLLTARFLVGASPADGTVPEPQVGLWVADPASGSARRYPMHLPGGDGIDMLTSDRIGTRALATVQDNNSGVISCRLYDLTDGHLIAQFRPIDVAAPHGTFAGVLSPDGHTAVVSVGGRTLATFALPSGRKRSSVQMRFYGASAARTLAVPIGFAPDGNLLVWGYDPGPSPSTPHAGASRSPAPAGPPRRQQLELVDPATGRDIGDALLGSGDFPVPPVWSPDGQRLAIGTQAGSLEIFDAATLRPLTGRIVAASGYVNSVAFSPDGKTLVTGGTDAEFSVWDGTTGQRIGPPIQTGDADVWAWFDQRGDVTGYAEYLGDNQQRRFDYPGHPADWLATACRTAGGDLTRSEWRRYVADQPYRPPCG